MLYPKDNSYSAKSIINFVNVKSMDENKTRLLASIGTIYLVKEFFVVDSLIECRCDQICCAGNFGNHYQKCCRENVVSTSSQNHEATYDAIYKNGVPLHSNVTI